VARPHVEFIHAPQLPWVESGLQGWAWRPLACKTLSADTDNGGMTALLQFAPGFTDREFVLAADFELFVLEGGIEINSREYGLDGYAFLPAGYRYQSLTSRAGAVVLAFFNVGPARKPWASASASASASEPNGLIERIDTYAMPWTTADIDPAVQFLRLSHKVLRYVPATGAKTILLATGAQTHPRDFREAQLQHDCVEEMYLLGGEITGERGVMYEGAYFWRPPGKWHGPFGSRRGSLSLVRFVDGHHQNTWSQQALPFSFEPDYQPELPAELAALASQPWSPPRH
jgi:hypothetical protein